MRVRRPEMAQPQRADSWSGTEDIPDNTRRECSVGTSHYCTRPSVLVCLGPSHADLACLGVCARNSATIMALREELSSGRVPQLEAQAPDAEQERLINERTSLTYLVKYASKPNHFHGGRGGHGVCRFHFPSSAASTRWPRRGTRA